MEKLDEISMETLGSYKKKASEQATKADTEASSAYKQGDKEKGKKLTNLANKRFGGIVNATKKEFAKTMTNEEMEEKKKEVVKNIIKTKTGKTEKFDPDPEIHEKDTLVKT